MKIGIDAHKFATRNPTGTERYSRDVIEGLVRARSGDDTLILYTHRPLPFAKEQGLQVRRIRHIPFIKPFTYAGLSLEMLFRPPDVLFVPAHELPPIGNRCSVVTIHDIAFRKFPSAYSLLQRRRLERSTRRAVRAAKKIICVSETTRRDLEELFGAPKEKLAVIYPGFRPAVPGEIDLKGRAATLRKLRITEGQYFLFFGRIEEKKNLVRLVTALNAARKAGKTDYRLVLAGSPGTGAEEVRATVKRLRLSGEVVMPGYVDERTKHHLLTGAGALVVPSLYEGFGYPVLEAFTYSVPVIISESGSLPEVAGEAALSFDPLDVETLKKHLIAISSDQRLRETLIQRGKERLGAFDPDRAARQVLRVLKEAAE